MQDFSPAVAHRVRHGSVIVRGADGKPLGDAEVVVEQTRHDFLFGNIGFDFVDLAAGDVTDADELRRLGRLADDWLELFNTATLPFYLGRFEPEYGRPRTAALKATAQWFAGNGVTLKGHPLVWHTVAPQWLLGLTADEIEERLRARVRREVTDFAGLVDTWDAINEVVIMPVFEAEDNGVTRLARERDRVSMVRLAVEEARAANPDVFLLLNDFDLSPAYERLIEEVLDAGIRLDAIGLQTHMHQGFRGEEELSSIADRFARFGLPLHFTETSLVSGDLMPREIVDLNDHRVESWPSTREGEARQADELVRHYRTLVEHPAVEAITYWGISDRGAWLGAPIGLIRADGSRKPSFDALHALVKNEWWLSPTALRTDADGRLAVRGFRGDYRVTSRARSASFRLDGDGDADVVLR